MLFNRIIGALTFRKDVYAEVENDASFTSSAWLLVALIAFLNQLGSRAGLLQHNRFFIWIAGAIVAAIFALLGFAFAAWVIGWVGKGLFKAQTDFGELVRVMGLAYVWNGVGVLGVLAAISPALICLLSPVTIAAAILGLIAWFVAVKEALDLDWVPTIVTVIIGWVVSFIIMAISGLVLGALGWGAASVLGAIGQ